MTSRKGKSKKNPISENKIRISPEVWGPHYWYVLHSMAYNYPEYPTNVTKKKYFEFIMNLPLFLPDQSMGNYFAELLERYPISPFLDNRESFIRWVHFIHNKVNVKLGKQEISIYKALDEFYYQSLPRPVVHHRKHQTWRDIAYIMSLSALVLFMYMMT
jgi:hypothetical protein